MWSHPLLANCEEGGVITIQFDAALETVGTQRCGSLSILAGSCGKPGDAAALMICGDIRGASEEERTSTFPFSRQPCLCRAGAFYTRHLFELFKGLRRGIAGESTMKSACSIEPAPRAWRTSVAP